MTYLLLYCHYLVMHCHDNVESKEKVLIQINPIDFMATEYISIAEDK